MVQTGSWGLFSAVSIFADTQFGRMQLQKLIKVLVECDDFILSICVFNAFTEKGFIFWFQIKYK